MAELLLKELLGTGGKRKCYLHPEDDNKVVKVHLPNLQELGLKEKLTPNENELFCYNKLIKNADQSIYEVIPKVYGTVNTNFQDGLVIERLRLHGANGESILSIDEYIIHCSKKRSFDICLNVMRLFFDNLRKFKIIVRDLGPKNFIVTGDEDQPDSLRVKISDLEYVNMLRFEKKLLFFIPRRIFVERSIKRLKKFILAATNDHISKEEADLIQGL